MEHRKWGYYAPIKGQTSFRPTCIDEHNALYDAWEVERDRADDLLKDRNAIQQKLDEARKRIAELESPTRVPFSDAQIERMAKAAHNEWHEEPSDAEWNSESHKKQREWCSVVRAALAAGGLEPCAVPEYDPAAAQVNDLRVQVQNLTAERDHKDKGWNRTLKQWEKALGELNEAKKSLDAESELVRIYKQDRDDALAELAQRACVPVKVRWNVSDEHIKMAVELGTFIRLDLDKVAHLREVFAAHAVIDAPAGVPSVEELVEIALGTSEPHGVSHRQVAAIRDTVLAGLAQPSSNAVQFDADEVEALARVLYNVKHHGWTWDKAKAHCVEQARAAIAHMRQRPEGLPTAEMVGREMADIQQSIGSDKEYGQAMLDYLAPFLRDPVGWELDLQPHELRKAYYDGMWDEAIALIRSRIKPAFECKECARLKQRLNYAGDAWRRIVGYEANDALTDALEGE